MRGRNPGLRVQVGSDWSASRLPIVTDLNGDSQTDLT